jgi:hypothetical protein
MIRNFPFGRIADLAVLPSLQPTSANSGHSRTPCQTNEFDPFPASGILPKGFRREKFGPTLMGTSLNLGRSLPDALSDSRRIINAAVGRGRAVRSLAACSQGEQSKLSGGS